MNTQLPSHETSFAPFRGCIIIIRTGILLHTSKITAPGVKSWKALLELGKVKMFPILIEIFRLSQAQDDSILMERLEAQAVNQACTLVYTSGGFHYYPLSGVFCQCDPNLRPRYNWQP